MTIQAIHGTIITFETQIDLCRTKKFTEIAKISFAVFGIPAKCPWTDDSIFCYKNEAKIVSEASKKMLGFVGRFKETHLRFSITHDTGKSCFQTENQMIAIKT